MQLVLRQGNKAQYRIIVRDETTNKSKSIGIYNTDQENIDELINSVKNLLETKDKTDNSNGTI